MRDISARELKGHNILAVERFQDNTRWMIEFSILRPCSYSREYRARNLEKQREYERIKAREYRSRKKAQAAAAPVQ